MYHENPFALYLWVNNKSLKDGGVTIFRCMTNCFIFHATISITPKGGNIYSTTQIKNKLRDEKLKLKNSKIRMSFCFCDICLKIILFTLLLHNRHSLHNVKYR